MVLHLYRKEKHPHIHDDCSIVLCVIFDIQTGPYLNIRFSSIPTIPLSKNEEKRI